MGDTTSNQPGTVFVHCHRVRYHETDAQGFLFNSRYLELADVAMTEYFRALGLPYLELLSAGVDPSLVDAQLQFAIPARFEDELSMPVACARVGTSSFVLDMEVTRDEARLARMVLTYVNVDSSTVTSRPLPDNVAAALRAQTHTD